jgi:hypothetical protein
MNFNATICTYPYSYPRHFGLQRRNMTHNHHGGFKPGLSAHTTRRFEPRVIATYRFREFRLSASKNYPTSRERNFFTRFERLTSSTPRTTRITSTTSAPSTCTARSGFGSSITTPLTCAWGLMILATLTTPAGCSPSCTPASTEQAHHC